MKGIGYLDRVENHTIHIYQRQGELPMFRQKRVDRMIEALNELHSVGNIDVYLLNGNKQRKLFTKHL